MWNKDIAYLYVEFVRYFVGSLWWRWSVCGGSKPTIEEKGEEIVWGRRSAHGGNKSTRGEKNGV